jgi:hypothetical protein
MSSKLVPNERGLSIDLSEGGEKAKVHNSGGEEFEFEGRRVGNNGLALGAFAVKQGPLKEPC